MLYFIHLSQKTQSCCLCRVVLVFNYAPRYEALDGMRVECYVSLTYILAEAELAASSLIRLLQEK